MKRSCPLLLAFVAAAFAQSSTPQLSAGAAARFLEQATWGPTPASIAQLQQMGIANWLDGAVRVEYIRPARPTAGHCGRPEELRSPSGAGSVFSEHCHRAGSTAAARCLRAQPDLGGLVGGRSSARICLPAVLAALPRQRLRKLSRRDSGRDPQPRHGTLSEHGQQQQSQPDEGHVGQRELRSRV